MYISNGLLQHAIKLQKSAACSSSDVGNAKTGLNFVPNTSRSVNSNNFFGRGCSECSVGPQDMCAIPRTERV